MIVWLTDSYLLFPFLHFYLPAPELILALPHPPNLRFGSCLIESFFSSTWPAITRLPLRLLSLPMPKGLTCSLPRYIPGTTILYSPRSWAMASFWLQVPDSSNVISSYSKCFSILKEDIRPFSQLLTYYPYHPYHQYYPYHRQNISYCN